MKRNRIADIENDAISNLVNLKVMWVNIKHTHPAGPSFNWIFHSPSRDIDENLLATIPAELKLLNNLQEL